LSPDGPRHRLTVLAGLVVLLGWSSAPAAGPLLVAAGDVEATTAIVWTRAERAGELTVEYGATGTPPSGVVRVPVADGSIAKVRLTGLAPGTRHTYRVIAAGASASGEFVTSPRPDEPSPVRFAWSADLGGGRSCRPVATGYRVFRALAARRPDFFLFVGDTIYADHRCGGPGLVPGSDFVATTLAQYRDKHAYNREDPAVRAFLERTSVSAIWDDHEVRNDFAGPSAPLMPVGRQAFLDWWPILPPPEEPGRLYRSLRWGRLLEVFILDTRQYRSDNTEPDGPDKTMLGAEQRRWLIDRVGASAATWKVVVTSVPLSVPTGRRHRDSWSSASVWGLPEEGAGFATERDAILGALRARGVKNLVFVAGDVHHAEVARHRPAEGFVIHELIAGPLSAPFGRPRPLDMGLGAHSLFARSGVNNFGEVTVDGGGFTVRILDEEATVLFTHTIAPE
jgi:alkaline phosphatase D